MNKYLAIIPRSDDWEIVEAGSSETAYAMICSWYMPNKKIIIINLKTKETDIFTRELDSNGNLIRIHKWIEKELVKEFEK